MTSVDVAFAYFSHESNTFVENPAKTTRADFRARWEYTGPAVTDELAATETEVGGAIEQAADDGIDLHPILATSATPGPPVASDAYEYYTDEIVRGIESLESRIDGVLLGLHGAMVTTDRPDGEGPLLARVRDAVGTDVPVVATLDLHANVSDQMVDNADALVAYKDYPHLDKARTGARAVQILATMIREDVRPAMHVERPPQIIFQPKAYTPRGPMKEIMDRSRQLERRDGVLATNVCVGYYHADVPEMGVTTPTVTAGDEELAAEISRELASLLWSRRHDLVDTYPGPEEAVDEANRRRAALGAGAGPVVMGDFGSNPGGGGASDGTTIPRALLEQEVPDAGYAIMYDPEVRDACLEAGVGSTLTVTLGGKTDDNHGEPIEDLEVYVKTITDGRYVNTGTSHSGTGVQNDLGPTVLIQCGPDRSLNVIVAGVRESAFDAEIWRHVGIQPERLGVLCVPSFIAFLGDYEPLAGDVVLADTPGVSAVDPARFDYKHIPRPLFPLDEVDPAELGAIDGGHA